MNTHASINIWRLVLTAYFTIDKSGVVLRFNWYKKTEL